METYSLAILNKLNSHSNPQIDITTNSSCYLYEES